MNNRELVSGKKIGQDIEKEEALNDITFIENISSMEYMQLDFLSGDINTIPHNLDTKIPWQFYLFQGFFIVTGFIFLNLLT